MELGLMELMRCAEKQAETQEAIRLEGSELTPETPYLRGSLGGPEHHQQVPRGREAPARTSRCTPVSMRPLLPSPSRPFRDVSKHENWRS